MIKIGRELTSINYHWTSLYIDGNYAEYTANYKFKCKTLTIVAKYDKKTNPDYNKLQASYVIDTILDLDINEPQKTIDRFMKLLVLK